eukprot:3196252-Amphidinium_carterae.1
MPVCAEIPQISAGGARVQSRTLVEKVLHARAADAFSYIQPLQQAVQQSIGVLVCFQVRASYVNTPTYSRESFRRCVVVS